MDHYISKVPTDTSQVTERETDRKTEEKRE
jgi:hypothetical protein